MKSKLEILFEDEAIVVINKPPGLLSIPDRYSPEKANLYSLLNEKYGKIFTVHRLDKETSGILVFARTEEVHKHLSNQFEHRTVEKIYLALVEGRIHKESGTIDKPISNSLTTPGKMVIHTRGKSSLTHYKVKEYFNHYTLLEAEIKTGRTHQIRVHFESIGYPLAIDAIYGRKDAFFLSDLKLRKYRLGKGQEERPLMKRNSLHAFRLSLEHPVKNELVQFEAPVPKDFNAVLKQLRKWNG